MDQLLFAVGDIGDLWYAVPLIIAISLVYAATRHELLSSILYHAFRVGVWLVGFMGTVFAVLLLIMWWL